MVMSKLFFSEAGSIRHHKQEGLQPSLVALLNTASSLAQKIFKLFLIPSGPLSVLMLAMAA